MNDFIKKNNYDNKYLEENCDSDFYDILNSKDLTSNDFIIFELDGNYIKLTIVYNNKNAKTKFIDNRYYNRKVINKFFSWN